jgi:hypothetical protein
MMVKRTLSLPVGDRSGRGSRGKRVNRTVPGKIPHPYVDRGPAGVLRYQQDGGLPVVKDPEPVQRVMLTLQAYQRHNTLQPALQPTHRMLLRWAEGGGNGLPNPEAEIRETHYDPLPPDLQTKVDDIVDGCAWETFARRWYRTSLTAKELAAEMCITRTQLYKDWNACLWYFTGRFESERIYG